MAPEHLKAMEELIGLWNAGDWDGVFDHYHEDAVFEDNLLPDGDTYRGIAEIRARFEELRSLAGDFKVETESMLDVGADVVWVNRVHGQLSDDVPPFDSLAGAVFSFEGNRVIRLRWYPSPEAALAAAGLDPETAPGS